ncbi:hypothetical protein EDC96DRAFT_587866 [Choanephora cucurbitarum]|nr:hypothetical protein EDC96DRAFT_587866 [Choanephora cucurbitarum]
MSNNKNNNRQAIPIDTPSRFVARVNNEIRQKNTMSLELNELKTLMTDIQKSTQDFKSTTRQEMAKKDAQIQDMSTQMHVLKKELDGLKTMVKRVMASTSIGRGPGKITRNAIRVSLQLLYFRLLRLRTAMKTAEVRALRDIQRKIDSSLMNNEENMKIASSIVAQLAVRPKVSEVDASLKCGPTQKRKYFVEIFRSGINSLKREAEDEIKPVAVQALKRLRNNASSCKTYVLRERRTAFSKNVDDCVEKFGHHAECERLLCDDTTSDLEDVIENNEEITVRKAPSYRRTKCILFFNYLNECRRSTKKMGQFGTAKKTRLEFGDVEAPLSVKKLPSWGIREDTFGEQESVSLSDLDCK